MLFGLNYHHFPSFLRYEMYSNKALTLTFGEQAENHVGMQKIGKLAEHGFTIEDMQFVRQRFLDMGCLDCNIYNLKEMSGICDPAILEKMEDAFVLIARRGVDYLLRDIGRDRITMFQEQNNLTPDSKAFMYGRVVNKVARHNLCFSEEAQEPDYENKKGRVVAFRDVPETLYVKERLEGLFRINESFVGEGNYYYDVRKCGIGFHGDSERKKIVAVKLGEVVPLHYQWFYNRLPVGNRIELFSGDGDVYIMSEKATGCDWKSSRKYTLRHAVGCPKFTTIAPKKEKKEKKEKK